MATKIVGLDLGTHAVKVCELVTTFRNFELVGFGVESVGASGEPEFLRAATGAPGPADIDSPFAPLAAAARRLLERRGLLHEAIYCSLPSGLAASAIVELPFDQPRKIEAVLPGQLSETVPLDTDELVYDYQIIERKPGGGVRLAVAYLKSSILVELLSALSQAGVDPKLLSLGVLNFAQLAEHLGQAPEAGLTAVVDVGHQHVELTILEGTTPVLVRTLGGGGKELTLALSDAFDVDAISAERGKLAEGAIGGGQELPANEGPQARRALIAKVSRETYGPWIRELKRSLAVAEVSRGRSIGVVYYTGGGAELKGFAAWLEYSLGIKVEPLDPLGFAFSRIAGSTSELRPFSAKALGQCLKALQRTTQLNFRKGEFAYTGDLGFFKGRIISLAVFAVVIVVLASMVVVSRKRVLEAEHQTLVAQVEALSEPILGYEADDIDLLLAAVTAGEKEAGNLVPTVSALDILYDLSSGIEFNIPIDIDTLEIDLERKKFGITGKTTSGGDVERIVDAIRSTRCFKGRINKERVEMTMDKRTKFRVSAAPTCG